MKKTLLLLLAGLLIVLGGCAPENNAQVVATTRPIYDFTNYICQNTDVSVKLLVTEEVSCLHDYSLQIWQMRALENADMTIINGAGLEDFLLDVLPTGTNLVDCSAGIALICPEEHHEHDHDGHHHENDPHYWLDTSCAKIMAQNICNALIAQYPQWKGTFNANLQLLNTELDALYAYGQESLSQISSRDLITFHDGFSYFAHCFDLNILAAVEEESGAEASAAELIELIETVNNHKLPAIFTEVSGSTSAAQIIANETGVNIYALDMGMSGKSYFETMYHNINTIKEALK